MSRVQHPLTVCGLPQEWQIIEYCRRPRTIRNVMKRFGCSFDVKELLDRMYERGDLQRLLGGARYPRIFWYVVPPEDDEWVRDHFGSPVRWVLSSCRFLPRGRLQRD